MLNHQDYAFVTSFENATIMKKELQPLVNLGFLIFDLSIIRLSYLVVWVKNSK